MPVLKQLLIFSVLLAPVAFAQEQGQYRSRIMLDPLGEMGKGSEMSVAELEQQINSIDDPYAKSSAGRFLARHYVQQKDYVSAIEYYEQALMTEGLSDVANREMLRELAQVYLLDENYRQAAVVLQRALDIDLVPDARDFLLLAQAQYRLTDYVAVVAALDGIQANGLRLELQQMHQALALYYRAGAFEQCEGILKQLLKIEPGNPENWHQLASVYLQQNKRKQALDHLNLALEKKVPFTDAELLLLVDLQAINGNPHGAATILQSAIEQDVLPADAANQKKLFELWLQARERDKARTALERAARASGDTELYLYLAQLQMEDQEWQPMQATLLAACSEQLQDRYVSRANLLLGVSLLKQGRETEARRAFINATLIGGANAQAAQWLSYMEAQPASENELRRVRGPCYGSEGKKNSLDDEPVTQAKTALAEPVVAETSADASQPVLIKTVADMRFFYSSHSEPIAQLLPEVKSLAARLNVSLVKASGNANGPLHLLSLPGEELRLAIPLRGSAQARGRYRIYNAEEFKCAYMTLDATAKEPLAAVAEFAEKVEASGHRLTSEYRLLMNQGKNPTFELQLGIE
ncbi:MAG: tetratricopeptide repeat protein [Halioglobus sp.]